LARVSPNSGPPDGIVAIALSGVTKRFGSTTAVDSVTFTVMAGEVFGLLGHNGAGKTTTVRLLNGILEPDSGSASVLGLDPSSSGSTLRRRTGVLTETATLEDRLTAAENLETYGAIYGLRADPLRKRVKTLLAEFGLEDRAAQRVGAFSHGMRQRLALARVLLHDPEALFLDEPTSGLDPAATRQFHDLVRSLSRTDRRTVVICTHNLHEAEDLCDRFAVLRQGKLLAVGTARDLAEGIGAPTTVELDVSTPPGLDVLRAIASTAGARAASWDGSLLRVEHGSRDLAAELVAILVSDGCKVYGARVNEPSLEDVYFALGAGMEVER
jgi:ABC-2 type transport system ATP-binding protein